MTTATSGERLFSKLETIKSDRKKKIGQDGVTLVMYDDVFDSFAEV